MIFKPYDSTEFDNKISKAVTYKQYITILTHMDGIVKQIYRKAVKFHNKGDYTRKRVVIRHNKTPDFSKVLEFVNDMATLDYFLDAFDLIRAKAYSLESRKKVLVYLKQSQIKCKEALNTILAVTHSRVSSFAPEKLNIFSKKIQEFTDTYLESSSSSVFTLPHSSDEIETDYTCFIVLTNVISSKNFIIPEITIAITAYSNFGHTLYKLSFPPNVFSDLNNEIQIKDENQLIEEVKPRLEDILNIKLTKPINVPKSPIVKLSNIVESFVEDGSLFVRLNSGTPAKQINSLIIRVISIIHEVIGIPKSKCQIIHRLTIDENQHRLIEFVLYDSDYFNRKPLSNLSKMLSLSKVDISNFINTVCQK